MPQTKRLLCLILFFCAFPPLSKTGAIFRDLVASAQDAAPTDIPPHTPNPALQEAANQIAERAKKLGCKSGSCLVLVLDFFTTKDATSVAGSQLAQDLGLLLAKPLSPGRVVDATTLKIFQAEERIPTKYFNEADAARWLGAEFHAALVLQGQLDFSKPPPTARFVLFDSNSKKKTQELNVQLPLLNAFPEDLKPSEPYPPLAPLTVARNGAPVFKSGRGTKLAAQPRCTYMPNPNYTEAARAAKFNGAVSLEAIVNLDNRLENLRVVKGIPYNLNQSALDGLQNWQCTPGTLDGKPVASVIQLEVNFRLY
jgi:TonB family protein